MIDLFTTLGDELDRELSKTDKTIEGSQSRDQRANTLPVKQDPSFIKSVADRTYTINKPRKIVPKVKQPSLPIETIQINVNGNLVTLPRDLVIDKIYSLIRANKSQCKVNATVLDTLDGCNYIYVSSKTVEKTATRIRKINRNKTAWEENIQGLAENERNCQYKASKDVKEVFQLLTIDTVSLIKLDNTVLLTEVKDLKSNHPIVNYNRRNIVIDTIGAYSTVYFEKISKDNGLHSLADSNGYIKVRLKLNHLGQVLASVDRSVYHDIVMGSYQLIKITHTSSGITVLDDYVAYRKEDNVLNNFINPDRLHDNLSKIVKTVLPLLPYAKDIQAKRKKDLKICKNTLRKILESLGYNPTIYNQRLLNTVNFPESKLIDLLMEYHNVNSLVWLKQWLLAVKHNPQAYLTDLHCLARYIC